MKGFAKRLRLWSILAILVRGLTLIPALIDSDEAWFSASAAALQKAPWRFFQLAIDNKPPGTVWFYCLVGELFGAYPSPRLVRGASLIVLYLASRAVARIARRLSATDVEAELAGLLFIIASSILGPQSLATTNEGLMVALVCGAYAGILGGEGDGVVRRGVRDFVAGGLLGLAALFKQTGIFFALPAFAILLFNPRKGKDLEVLPRHWQRAFATAFGMGSVLSVAIAALGSADFFYWTWTYPLLTLNQARAALFSFADIATTVILVLLAWLPLYLGSRRPRRVAMRDLFMGSWALSGALAVALGRGLFTHYYLVLAAPLALWAAFNLQTLALSGWRRHWLTYAFLGSVLVSSWPRGNLFWGIDLAYEGELAKRIVSLTEPSDRIWIWGGTAAPISLSQRPYASPFASARFLMPPYTTDRIRAQFEAAISASPPRLIVDLHERRDNRFDLAPTQYPWLADFLQARYVGIADPALPWATFYIPRETWSRGLPVPSPWVASTAPSSRRLEAAWQKSRAEPFPHSVGELDRQEKRARVRMSIALLPTPARVLLEEEIEREKNDPTAIERKVSDAFTSSGMGQPFPLSSRWWWASWSIVELQPGSGANDASGAQGTPPNPLPFP